MNENEVNPPCGGDPDSSTVSLRLPHPLLNTVAAIARSESIFVTDASRQMIERGVQAWVEEQR